MWIFNGKSRRFSFKMQRKNSTKPLQDLGKRNHFLSFAQLRGIVDLQK